MIMIIVITSSRSEPISSLSSTLNNAKPDADSYNVKKLVVLISFYIIYNDYDE